MTTTAGNVLPPFSFFSGKNIRKHWFDPFNVKMDAEESALRWMMEANWMYSGLFCVNTANGSVEKEFIHFFTEHINLHGGKYVNNDAKLLLELGRHSTRLGKKWL